MDANKGNLKNAPPVLRKNGTEVRASEMMGRQFGITWRENEMLKRGFEML